MENKVLARVNGREITQFDLNGLMQNLGQRAMQFATDEGKKQLVEELITQELLYADAIENNIEKDEEFQKALEDMKVTLLKQYAMRKVLSDVDVTDEEVKEYYESNKEMFKTPEEVRASHILVSTEEEAKEVAAKIKEGASFEEMAKENSSCPSSQNGGDLGAFSRGKMVPEFENAAFELEIGAVSEPVQTQFGFHLIKVTEKNEARTQEFEEVKENMKNQLIAMKQNELYVAKREELEKKYEIERL
ncbi:peptidyl-prolyl cis-trans isomerase [Oceanirhabdus sp. W0125-5]|uniref:peptidyl-prolyl cis-trans isomerase n=1 Tax=Oceanirhabdus sp. W0125-5 TaxID=2999116 RepID=UPI0022F34521|nr:peptidyl-prolyl cis-trans isomerase [Oceanirhabdus sp. W0125-5]WBW97894.1 peptidyl-prolyl cis-trans isomerase [Oceanirhabdus sp. W0125-5]